MTLEELALSGLGVTASRVPAWAFGTVRRRSITFAPGVCDDQTIVYWVQAHGMTGDIRIHPARPALSVATRLEHLTREQLTRLASIEGGTAFTSWADGLMSWSDWIGFQPYDKYPESGLMQRIGDCMIEFAPSGTYVEDWRFQPSEPGLMAGLQLVSETDDTGYERPRRGGLVIAGDHAICSVARRDELPEGTRAQDYVRTSADPVAALEQLFDCTVDYAVRSGADWIIKSSTDPRREGLKAAWTSGFCKSSAGNVVSQCLDAIPGTKSRQWKIDSLEANCAFPLSTPVAAERLAWLAAEADTLLAPLTHSLDETA